jgi:hypothetical protein
MLNSFQQRANRVGDNVFAASRQVWLAGLGAAVVTREWASSEASGVFRTLVKEGTAVESRAIRLVGDQVESSVNRASDVLKQTRAVIESVVRNYGDTAVGIFRKSLPRLTSEVAIVTKPSQRRVSKPAKAARKQTKPAVRASKRTSKR